MSDIVERVNAAIAYSQNFATAKPDIGKTEYEHIAGLCSMLTEAVEELERARTRADALQARYNAEVDRSYGAHGLTADNILCALQSEIDDNGCAWLRQLELDALMTAMWAAPVPASDSKDAKRYRWLRGNATQRTAHDVYGDGGHWMTGVFSDDSARSFDEAIDAAIEQSSTLRDNLREGGEG